MPNPLIAIIVAVLVAVPAATGAAADAVTRHELGMLSWGAIALGTLAGVLPRAWPPLAIRVLMAGLMALSALTALSLAWTSSAERTVEELARVVGYAGIVVLLLVSFRREHWRAAGAGLAIGIGAICVLALVARLLPAEFGDQIVEGARLAYPLDYWNALAAWSAIAVAFALAWSADGRRSVQRGIALGSLPAFGACLYLTYSRGGVIAALLGAATVVLLSSNRRRAVFHGIIGLVAIAGVVLVIRSQPGVARGVSADGAGIVFLALVLSSAGCWWAERLTRRRLTTGSRSRPELNGRAAAALVASVCVVAVLVPTVFGQLWETEPLATAATDDPAARFGNLDGDRPSYWSAALDAFVADPVGGLGAGTFEFWWSRHGDEPEQVRDAHSLYLEQLAELGLPGALATLAVVGGALWLALLPLRRSSEDGAAVALPSAVVVFVVYAGVDWLWESTAVTVVALASAAIAGAAGSARAGYRGRRAALLFAVAVVGAGVQVPGLVSNSRLEDARAALAAGSPEHAVELAGDALEAAPWAASPFAERAVAESARGRHTAAVEDALEAARREPLNFRRWLAVAEFAEELGDREAALAAYEVARMLGPRSVLVQGVHGRELLERIRALPAGEVEPDPDP